MVEIKASKIFNNMILENISFGNLTTISGTDAFGQMKEETTSLEFPELVEISGDNAFMRNDGKSGVTSINSFKFPKLKDITGNFAFRSTVLSDVQMPSLKGANSTGNNAFYDTEIDDKTIISIDEIKGTHWFNSAIIKGTKFPNLTKITASNAFYQMGEGTTGLSFPKLKDIEGVSSFSLGTISDVEFTTLESITCFKCFRESTLSNVQMPILKGNNSTGDQVFYRAVLDDKTIISIDEIKGSYWFEGATIKGSQFPNLTKISGSDAFDSMKEGTTSLEFPELVEISGAGAFSGNNGNSGIATISGFKFPKLKDINGTNTFMKSVISNVEFLALETVGGSSNFSYSVIEDGQIEFPNLKSVSRSNFSYFDTLMNIKLVAEVPTTGSPNFQYGGAGKYLTTPTYDDRKGYILDDQDGEAADGFWFGFKTHDAVVFDSNGGSETVVELVDKTTKRVSEPIIPTKNNHTFEGWFYVDGTEFTFDGSGKSNDTVEGTKTVKAKLSKNYYTLKYNGNGGVGVMADVNIDQGEQVTVLNSTFTKESYTFNHWNTKQNGLDGMEYFPGGSLNPDDIPDPILSRI